MGSGIRIAWFAVLTVVGLGAVAHSLLVPGPFDWHVRQPATWQGALEVIALVGLVWAALRFGMTAAWRAAFALPAIALYLRRHHVDLELLVVLAWFEGLFALGTLALRRDDAEAPDAWLRRLIAGVVVLALVLWIAQLAGYGLPRTQRLLAIALLVPAAAWGFRRWETRKMLCAAFGESDRGAQPWVALLLVAPCVLMARSNVVTDPDSLWYGFRPERVLVGDASVFDALGLVSPVHYFPKFYEVLTLPFAAAREASLLQAPAVVLGALLARLVWGWLRDLGHERTPALAGAALAWSLPAFSNITLSAKPDAFAALMVVAMAWFCWRLHTTRDARTLPWVLACATLAAASKLAVLPYVGVMGCAFLFLWARHGTAPGTRVDVRDAWPLAGSALLLVLVSARTFVLTGMPTVGPEQLVMLWQALGMSLRFPVGTMDWTGSLPWTSVPGILHGWGLAPSRFTHLQISWPGNVWWLLPLAVAGLPRVRAAMPSRWLLWLLPATGLAMLLTVAFINEGGDGNYFLAPVVLATIAAVDLAFRRLREGPVRAAAFAMLATFTLFHGAYSFVSAGWQTGTRAWDLDVARPNRDQHAKDLHALAEKRLSHVAAFLHEAGGRRRVVGRAADDRLPARYEEVDNLLFAHMDRRGPPLMEQLLACAKVEAYLLPRDAAASPYPEITQFEASLHALPASADWHADEHWRLVGLATRLPPCTR